MTAHLRGALRWLGGFFDVVDPEPPRLTCGCLPADSIIVACPDCNHATCDNHRTGHHCMKDGVNAH